MARAKKADMEVAMLDQVKEELALTKGNLLGAMTQVMEFSQKLERSQAALNRKIIALQQANKGITRLHAKMDRMRKAMDVERASMKRNMNVSARLIHAVETGRLAAGSNPEQHFRFRDPGSAIEFAKMLAGKF